MIPKILLQTSRNPYPQYMKDMWAERVDDSWKIEWFDDNAILKFFDDNPLPEFPRIKEVFNSFSEGAHKADLFRYYYLYLNGGFFIDFDFITHVHMNEVYSEEYDHMFVLSDLECNRTWHPEIDSPLIFNGFMGCVPKSRIVYDALVNAYGVKPRLLEKQRLYLVYQLYVITKAHEGGYSIKWLSETLPHADSPVAHTVDKDQKVIGGHHFGDPSNKFVPKQRLLVEDPGRAPVVFFTTFNAAGYEVYGRAWIKTFIEVAYKYPHLRAVVYYEGFKPRMYHPAVEYREFSEYLPHHSAWKQEYLQTTEHMPYTKACTIRFSHKAFVMQHMWETTSRGYAIWLDGDCVFKDYDFNDFPAKLIQNKPLACQVEIRTDTPVRHVESGIVIMNCAHPDKMKLIDKFREFYTTPHINAMPNDTYDTKTFGTWRDYGPYDGFILHKSLMASGIDFIDMNDGVRDEDNADFTANPDLTFLNPELHSRFFHNIGHQGKDRYVQVNVDLGIDAGFSWNGSKTEEALVWANLDQE